MQTEQRPARSRGRPRSAVAREQLAKRIERDAVPAGTRLPSEPELAAELGVSRATLRDALQALEAEGVVRRIHGRGTYVAARPRVANSLDVNFGVTQAIRMAGMHAGIEQAKHWTEPVEVSEAERLGLSPGQDVVVVERVRTADGVPVVLSRDILPRKLVGSRSDVVERMLTDSIYVVFERDLGIPIHHGVASFRPIRAEKTLASRLRVSTGELLLYLWQIDFARDETPVLSSHEYHLADAFDFSVVRRGPGGGLT